MSGNIESKSPILVRVKNLRKSFPRTQTWFSKKPSQASNVLRGINLSLVQGLTLGLVGESGSGKTTLGRCLVHLLRPDSGEIYFKDENSLAWDAEQLRQRRKEFQMVFQDPMASMNPRLRIKEILLEPFKIQNIPVNEEAESRELISAVGLSPSMLERYPHECSGGQRQRVGIARALALKPSLIVADEPVSALDVSIQAQILNLLSGLKQSMNLTMVFISHDLNVIEYMSQQIAVMYQGDIVEWADKRTFFAGPLHPYSQKLLRAADPKSHASLMEVVEPKTSDFVKAPDPKAELCPYIKMCPQAKGMCFEVKPKLLYQSALKNHAVACHLYQEEELSHGEKL